MIPQHLKRFRQRNELDLECKQELDRWVAVEVGNEKVSLEHHLDGIIAAAELRTNQVRQTLESQQAVSFAKVTRGKVELDNISTCSQELLSHLSSINYSVDPTAAKAISDLILLSTLRTRIQKTQRALEDSRRWASLNVIVKQNLNLDPTNWNELVRILKEAKLDYESLSPYLPEAERKNRDVILKSIGQEICTTCKSVIPLYFSRSQAIPKYIPQVCRAINQSTLEQVTEIYSNFRIENFRGHSSASNSENLHERIMDAIEKEAHMITSFESYDKGFWIQIFSKKFVSHLVDSTGSLEERQQDIEFSHRLETILQLYRSPLMETIMTRLLTRISEFPQFSYAHCKSIIQVAFSIKTPSTLKDALNIWLAALQSSLDAITALVYRHIKVCGSFRRKALVKQLDAIWGLLTNCSRDFLSGIIASKCGLPILEPEKRDHKRVAGEFSNELAACTDSFPVVEGACRIALDKVQSAALVIRNEFMNIDAKDSSSRFSHLVTENMKRLDIKDTKSELDDDAVALWTRQLIFSIVNTVLELAAAPARHILVNQILFPLFSMHTPNVTSQNTYISALYPRFANVVDSPLPNSKTGSARKVGALPTFSSSPSPGASMVGEYLLQLPEKLENIQYNLIPMVSGYSTMEFPLNCPLLTALQPVSHSQESVIQSHHIIEAILLLLQLDSLSLLHRQAKESMGQKMHSGDIILNGSSESSKSIVNEFSTQAQISSEFSFPENMRLQISHDLSYLSNLTRALDSSPRPEFEWTLCTLEGSGSDDISNSISQLMDGKACSFEDGILGTVALELLDKKSPKEWWQSYTRDLNSYFHPRE
jgi:hypothetical protein